MFETCLTEQIYPKLFALSTIKYSLPSSSTSIYLSKLVQVSRGLLRCREDEMSLRTGGVAVAVNASKGTFWRERGVRRRKREGCN